MVNYTSRSRYKTPEEEQLASNEGGYQPVDRFETYKFRTPAQEQYGSKEDMFDSFEAGDKESATSSAKYQPINAQYSGGKSGASGALTGAASGAMIGSAVAPGVGTAVGAGVGAVAGYAASAMEEKQRRKEAALAAARESLNKQAQTVVEAEDTRRNRIMDIIGAFRQGVA